MKEFVSDTGKLYTHLISIDHPSPTLATEKLRSYNKWINVPVRVDYQPATMTFHDDSTSVVQALWKEHLNFYSHQATIGDTISGIDTNSNLGSSQEVNSFQFTDDLTATDGGEMRSKMGTRPSLGMRLKPNDGRHFFESIIIYDLGTEPDSVNVYWFHRPIITAWNHDNLDKEDRTGNVRVSASFDYEGYYFTIGQNRGRLGDYIAHILGSIPGNLSSAPRKDGIARDGREGVVDRVVQKGQDVFEVFAAPEVQTFPLPAEEPTVFTPLASPLATPLAEPILENEVNPNLPASLEGKQRELDQTRDEKNDILNDVGEGESDLGEDEDKSRRLAELEEREKELVDGIKQQKKGIADRTVASPSEKSALENTKESAGTPPPPVSRTSVPDPTNQQTADHLFSEADRLDKLAANNAAIAESRQRSADRFAEQGNTKQARRAQRDANSFRRGAANASKNAGIARSEAESIDPKNQ